jgi:excisionase family DNA binding protein
MVLLDLPDVLTVEQAAALLRIDVLSVRRALAAGELPITTSRGNRLIDTKALLSELGVRFGPHSAPEMSRVEGGASDLDILRGRVCSKDVS